MFPWLPQHVSSISFIREKKSNHHHLLSDYPEYQLLVVLSIFTILRYLIRAKAVIDAFCNFLGIQCFTIPPSKYVENILPTHVGSDDEQEVEALLVNEQSIPQEQEYRTF